MKSVNIQSIIIDKGTQSRANINEYTVASYAEAMQEGATFPPVTLFHDGVDYYLADGFHRLHAVSRLGKASIAADVQPGTLRDAILYSLGANDKHGLQRSREDKRKCVMTLLEDFEWQSMSLTEMAKTCNVSRQLVAAVIEESKTGQKISSNPSPAKKPAKVKLKNVIEAPLDELPDELPAKEDGMDDAVAELIAENQRLADRLAVESMDASEEDKLAATQTIEELREQVRILEIEVQSLKISRDTYQRENAELKKTVASLQRQLKKAA